MSNVTKTVRNILVYTESWGTGGIEAFVLNAAEALKGANVHYDLFAVHKWSDELDERSRQLGINQYVVFKCSDPGLVKRTFKGPVEFKRIVSQGNYDAVHINTMNGMGFIYARIADKAGISSVVVHSHNSNFGNGLRELKSIGHRFGSFAWSKHASANLACSKESGRYLFGKKKFITLKNGIDLDRFSFNVEKRKQLRKDLGIEEDTLVAGTVGRLSDVKNPLRLIEIFSHLHNIVPNSVLLHLGDGPMRTECERLVEKLKLEDSYLLLGETANISPFYSAMDVFVLPSQYEGLSIACVEAQASGLPCVVSDAVTYDTDQTGLLRFLPLNAPSENWAKTIAAAKRIQRLGFQNELESAGFGLESLREVLERTYGINQQVEEG